MTLSDSVTRQDRAGDAISSRWYWAATGLFCLIFVISVLLTVFDPQGTVDQLEQLGFPVYLMYPQAIAKFLGVVAILSMRSRLLTNLAFAGFLYDLVLALFAHIAEGQIYGLVAVFGLVLWVAAFWADRRRFPPKPGY